MGFKKSVSSGSEMTAVQASSREDGLAEDIRGALESKNYSVCATARKFGLDCPMHAHIVHVLPIYSYYNVHV